jgi:hypothetical protein
VLQIEAIERTGPGLAKLVDAGTLEHRAGAGDALAHVYVDTLEGFRGTGSGVHGEVANGVAADAASDLPFDVGRHVLHSIEFEIRRAWHREHRDCDGEFATDHIHAVVIALGP